MSVGRRLGLTAPGYAYGTPVDYDPAVAEAWVFVEPRYLTSSTIYDYALPIGRLSIAFAGATNVYRPRYRSGVVFNFGIPRQNDNKGKKTGGGKGKGGKNKAKSQAKASGSGQGGDSGNKKNKKKSNKCKKNPNHPSCS